MVSLYGDRSSAHKQLRSEEDVLNGQLMRLKEFGGETSPPDKATFEQLAEYWRGSLVCELDNVSDEIRAKFAEFLDLYVTVRPMKSSKGYGFDITASIPLEMDGNTVNAYDMVFNPPRRGLRR